MSAILTHNIFLLMGLAFSAGLLAFISPCMLPVLPAYLSIFAGPREQVAHEKVTHGDITHVKDTHGEFIQAKKSPRLLLGSIAFVLGFSIVFVALGLFAYGVNAFLWAGARAIINIIAGIFVILLGLNFIFNFFELTQRQFSFMQRVRRLKGISHYASLVLLGLAFGFAWTPCVGPFLASILLLASQSEGLGRAALLLTSYTVGMGLPFILVSIFFSRLTRLRGFLTQHQYSIKIIAGIFLIILGALISTGWLTSISASLARWGLYF